MTRRRRLVLALGAALLAMPAAVAAWVAWPLPPSLRKPAPVPSITLVDRSGMPLRSTRSPEGLRGGWIGIEAMDADLIRAFIAAEDRRFLSHGGIDARALARAARDNLLRRRVVSGASTITMQAARLHLGDEPRRRGRPRWRGKAMEALWALRLEAHLGKDEILERYLNRVPLGEGTVGVAAAAALYFEASATELSLGQAALLAGLAQAPARDNPITSPARAAARRQLVLRRMERLGQVSAADAAAALTEPVAPRQAQARFLAPHFTTRVLAQLPPHATGLVRTTLDLDLQQALESEVRHTVATLADRAAAHAAVVVLDNVTGSVLAWVGSPDFFAAEAGQVDMVVSRRQPGSTLKPFLYGLAFDRGFTAASVLPDVPRTWPTAGGPYTPQNYDRRFRGPVRAREALASSYNVPAVDLAERVGTGALLRTLHDAGFASLAATPEHYGLGLALGNGDVSLIEIANAYRGLAAGGAWRPWRVLQDAGPATGDERRFMSRQAAALVLDILADPVARIGGFGTTTPLELPFRAAAKTGTSRHYSDNWAVATTARFTVAVWVGNFSGRPMQRVSGISGAAPLLRRAVLETARRHAPGTLVDPETAGLQPAVVCMLSGMRATPACPSMVEWFIPGTEPLQPDTWHAGDRITLPPEYAEWIAEATSPPNLTRGSSTLAGRDAVAGPESPAAAATTPHRILAPLDGDVFERPRGPEAGYATIPLVAAGTDPRWEVNGRVVPRPRWALVPGTHVITARWRDGTRDSVRILVH